MYSITKNGKPLDPSLYTIDEKNKIFASSEDNLVLDFSREYGWLFGTSSRCTFDTGSRCTFDTGSECTFEAGFECVVVRRDVYEVIELEAGRRIRLNGQGVKGFTYIEEAKGNQFYLQKPTS